MNKRQQRTEEWFESRLANAIYRELVERGCIFNQERFDELVQEGVVYEYSNTRLC